MHGRRPSPGSRSSPARRCPRSCRRSPRLCPSSPRRRPRSSRFPSAGVCRPPLDDELAIGLAPVTAVKMPEPPASVVRSSWYGISARSSPSDRQRGAAGRGAAVRGQELEASVRAHVRARVIGAVDRDRERERDLGRAVVAMVPDVRGARNDRLTGLGVRGVHDASGRGEARRGESDDRDCGGGDGQKEQTTGHCFLSPLFFRFLAAPDHEIDWESAAPEGTRARRLADDAAAE